MITMEIWIEDIKGNDVKLGEVQMSEDEARHFNGRTFSASVGISAPDLERLGIDGDDQVMAVNNEI